MKCSRAAALKEVGNTLSFSSEARQHAWLRLEGERWELESHSRRRRGERGPLPRASLGFFYGKDGWELRAGSLRPHLAAGRLWGGGGGGTLNSPDPFRFSRVGPASASSYAPECSGLSLQMQRGTVRSGLLLSADRRDLRADSLGFSLDMLRDRHPQRSLRRRAWKERQAYAWLGGSRLVGEEGRLDWELIGGLRGLPEHAGRRDRALAVGLRWRASRRFQQSLHLSRADHRLAWHRLEGKGGRRIRFQLAHWVGERPSVPGFGSWPWSQEAGSRAWGRRAGISWTPGWIRLRFQIAELHSLKPGSWELPPRRDWGLEMRWRQDALEVAAQVSSILHRARYGVQVNRRLSRSLTLRTGLRMDSPTGRLARSLFFQIRADRKNKGLRLHLVLRHGQRAPPVQALSPAPGILWLVSGSQEQSRFGIGCWKGFGSRDKGRLHVRIALELASKRREKRSAQEGLRETSHEWRSALNLVWNRP